MPPLTQW